MTLVTTRGAILRRPWIAWPLAGLAAAATLYCLAWVVTAYMLNSEIEKWTVRQRDAGTTIVHGDALISGFPAAVVIALPGWEMTRPSATGGWTWRTAVVRVRSTPWRPFAFTVDLAGRHTVTGALMTPGVAAWLSFARAEISPVLLPDGQVRSINLDLADAIVAEAADAPPLVSLSSAVIAAEPTTTEPPDETPAWRLSAEIAALRFPEATPLGPFLPELRKLTIDARLVGPIAPGPLVASLDAWRRNGGVLDLKSLDLDWPPLRATGAATLALDERLQPVGAGSVKFAGFFDTVDRMVTLEMVKPATASMARIVLGLMSRDGADGSPELTIGLTLQDGKLNAGPLPLMDVPPIAWDALR